MSGFPGNGGGGGGRGPKVSTAGGGGGMNTEDAEQDAREALAIDGDHIKAKFRLAKAQFRLGKPSEAFEIVQELLSEIPKDRSFQELSADCERTIQE